MNEIIKQIPLDKVAKSLTISLLALMASLLYNWAAGMDASSSEFVAVASAFAVAMSNELRKASARVDAAKPVSTADSEG